MMLVAGFMDISLASETLYSSSWLRVDAASFPGQTQLSITCSMVGWVDPGTCMVGWVDPETCMVGWVDPGTCMVGWVDPGTCMHVLYLR